jgi:hypothetical protein
VGVVGIGGLFSRRRSDMVAVTAPGESENPDDADARRAELLTQLIQRTRPVSDLLTLLGEFPWDSDPLVTVSATDIAAVLRDFLLDHLTHEQVEEWADALEVRDDVDVTFSLLQDVLFELANANLNGPLTRERARQILREIQG